MRRREVIWMLLGGVMLVGLLYFFNPLTAGFFPPCLFHRLTGLECIGCGSTRAVHALVHGEVVQAFWLNPLVISALPLLIVLLLRREPSRVRPALVVLFMIAILSFGVLRNVTALTP